LRAARGDAALRLEDTPSYLKFPGEAGHVRYGEGIFVGYRGYDALDRDVSYPFGHGLSYTQFEYADLQASVSGSVEDGNLAVEVTCRVSSTGQRRGKEVAQLYVGDPQASVARPPRELNGFAKVDLEPGASQTVTFTLGARDLSYWSPSTADWLVEPDEFTLAVGASSRDLRLTTLDVDASPLRVPLDGMATLDEWLADPAGSALVLDVVGTDESGRLRGMLADDDVRRVVGNFPMSSLAAFPGFGFDHRTLDEMVRPPERFIPAARSCS
jgi:beta-glucosidase